MSGTGFKHLTLDKILSWQAGSLRKRIINRENSDA
jgi:hypothetical protein